MISICLTCANNKAGKCAAGIGGDIDPEFICDFYRPKTSGAFRRKRAKLNAGNDVVFIVGTRGAGKRYVMEGKANEHLQHRNNQA